MNFGKRLRERISEIVCEDGVMFISSTLLLLTAIACLAAGVYGMSSKADGKIKDLSDKIKLLEREADAMRDEMDSMRDVLQPGSARDMEIIAPFEYDFSDGMRGEFAAGRVRVRYGSGAEKEFNYDAPELNVALNAENGNAVIKYGYLTVESAGAAVVNASLFFPATAAEFAAALNDRSGGPNVIIASKRGVYDMTGLINVEGGVKTAVFGNGAVILLGDGAVHAPDSPRAAFRGDTALYDLEFRVTASSGVNTALVFTDTSGGASGGIDVVLSGVKVTASDPARLGYAVNINNNARAEISDCDFVGGTKTALAASVKTRVNAKNTRIGTGGWGISAIINHSAAELYLNDATTVILDKKTVAKLSAGGYAAVSNDGGANHGNRIILRGAGDDEADLILDGENPYWQKPVS